MFAVVYRYTDSDLDSDTDSDLDSELIPMIPMICFLSRHVPTAKSPSCRSICIIVRSLDAKRTDYKSKMQKTITMITTTQGGGGWRSTMQFKKKCVWDKNVHE